MCTNWFYTKAHMIFQKLTDGSVDEYEVPEYKVFSDEHSDITSDVWNDFMFKRYSIHPEEMQSYLDTFASVKMLPAIISNPITEKLLVADYC
jgi:tetrahydromethanopterin S-methyltransferase subunit H